MEENLLEQRVTVWLRRSDGVRTRCLECGDEAPVYDRLEERTWRCQEHTKHDMTPCELTTWKVAGASCSLAYSLELEAPATRGEPITGGEPYCLI